jgi:hypothetical protein
MCETARWGENIGNGEFLSRPLREISTNQGHPRGVVLPALGALRGLGQARTEPARVPEGFPPLAGIVRGHCGAHSWSGSSETRAGCRRAALRLRGGMIHSEAGQV